MNRLTKLLSAMYAGYMATFAGAQERPKTYTLVLFSPDGKKTRRRQLRACEMERRYIRFEVGAMA